MEIAEKAEENPFLKLQEIFKDKKRKTYAVLHHMCSPHPHPKKFQYIEFIFVWLERGCQK